VRRNGSFGEKEVQMTMEMSERFSKEGFGAIRSG